MTHIGILLILCFLPPCSEASVVHGSWSSWFSWSVCSVRCGNGTRNRFRLCNSPSPSNGGRPCVGSRTQIVPCVNLCPVDGGWSAWQIIKRCTSVTKTACSLGRDAAIRHCNNPKPSNGGSPCVGLMTRVDECWDQTGCSPSLQKPLDYHTQSFRNKTVLVKWREAPYGARASVFHIFYRRSETSATGINAQSQPVSRQIPGPGSPPSGVIYSRILNLNDLTGRVQIWVEAERREASGSRAARTQRHTITVGETDGAWSSWGYWTDCSVTCAMGMHSRRRLCNNPTPSSGGRPCPGPAFESEVCDSGEFCP